MTLPMFPPGKDPGPDFAALLGRLGVRPADAGSPGSGLDTAAPHGTTIAAIRYADGVVMAGDRRATMGNVIAHRKMEKVLPVDRYSGVAIAGSAGQAMEMVKLFQTQVEHYEKVQGMPLSLEGKANYLGQLIRGNLPAAIQMGLLVVPLYAGFDARRRRGRIFTYDATGGRYEEADFHATGSGGQDARTTIKLGWRDAMDEAGAIELAVQALYEAAEEDSATGGPDPVRGIYPVVAAIDVAGFRHIPEEQVAERFAALIERRRAERHL